jgi:tetrahydromethanopterin S-methyltransferase subunit E
MNNQTSLCACLDPYTGVNCGLLGTGINIVLAAGLAAGIIAAIVVLGLLGLALCTGGAYAAASALGAAPSGNVVENPLYTDPQTAGGNPLFA